MGGTGDGREIEKEGERAEGGSLCVATELGFHTWSSVFFFPKHLPSSRAPTERPSSLRPLHVSPGFLFFLSSQIAQASALCFHYTSYFLL